MTDELHITLFFVAGTLLFMLFTFFIISYFLIQKRIQYANKLNILRAKLEEQEHAFTAISKELHDNIKSKLGTSQMTLYRIADLSTDKKQVMLIDRTNKVISEVINEVQNISHSLNGQFVKNIGLINAIKENLESVRIGKNINCCIDITGETFTFSPEKELNIFRIAQEAIQNCAKYSKAKNLSIFLNYQPNFFTMKITDDGIGFEKNKIHEMKGLGFINMFHRARFVQGALEVISEPLQGCTITLTLNVR